MKAKLFLSHESLSQNIILVHQLLHPRVFNLVSPLLGEIQFHEDVVFNDEQLVVIQLIQITDKSINK